MFCNFRHGFDCLRNGGKTLTPLIPLSLRAFKGEGEKRTEAEVGAEAPTSASSSVLGRREGKVGLFGWGVWVCIVFCLVCWVLGGRRKVRDSDAGSLWHLRRRHKHRRLSCLIPTYAIGDLPVSRASLGGAHPSCISARPLCGTAYRLEAAVGGGSRIRALRPCITSQ